MLVKLTKDCREGDPSLCRRMSARKTIEVSKLGQILQRFRTQGFRRLEPDRHAVISDESAPHFRHRTRGVSNREDKE